MEDPTVKILSKLADQVGERQDIVLNIIIYEDHIEAYVMPIYGEEDYESEDNAI